MAIWRYRSAINRTSARNKQSIFVLLSHQKCTLIDEITGLYFSWIVHKNSKNTSQIYLVAGSPIHLSACFSLWHIHAVQWMTSLWYFCYYLTVVLMFQNILYIVISFMKTHIVCHLVNTWIYFSLYVVIIRHVDCGQCNTFRSKI